MVIREIWHPKITQPALDDKGLIDQWNRYRQRMSRLYRAERSANFANNKALLNKVYQAQLNTLSTGDVFLKEAERRGFTKYVSRDGDIILS